MYTMSTHFITTTELREQSSKVVASLLAGENITLIHRSKMIGKITPIDSTHRVITDVKEFKKALDAAKPKKLIPRNQREKIYRDNLKKKYAPNLP